MTINDTINTLHGLTYLLCCPEKYALVNFPGTNKPRKLLTVFLSILRISLKKEINNVANDFRLETMDCPHASQYFACSNSLFLQFLQLVFVSSLLNFIDLHNLSNHYIYLSNLTNALSQLPMKNHALHMNRHVTLRKHL